MVLVAQPEPVGIDERPVAGAIVEDLTRILTTNVPFSPVRIREYPEIIGSSDEALKVAEANNAAVVIWGSYNADDVDLYIQVGDLSVFPYTTMERGVIERALNMSVRLQDPQQETIAPHVLWMMGTLLIIDGDAYHSMLVNAGLTQTFTHPAQVTDQSIATLDYHIRGDTHSDPQLELDGINQAIALDSVNPILYLIRGSIYQTMGEVDDARIDFETAQRLGPDSWAMPYIMLASIDNSNEAFALFDAVIERRPDDWFPQFMRAMLHYLNRRYDLAALEMQQVIALQPQANFPYVYEVMIDLRAGDLEAARAASHTILTEFPDPVLMSRMMVTSLGESAPNPYGIAIASFGYLVLGRYNDTITTAENGLESFLWYTDLNLMRGIAYCGLGRYEEAESAYTMAITMEEGIPLFHLMRGEVRLRQENTEGANADFAIATQNPAFVPLVEAMQSGALDCTTLLE
jgi:tetratricopeptide (TPR) repeat protein